MLLVGGRLARSPLALARCPLLPTGLLARLDAVDGRSRCRALLFRQVVGNETRDLQLAAKHHALLLLHGTAGALRVEADDHRLALLVGLLLLMRLLVFNATLLVFVAVMRTVVLSDRRCLF